MISHDRLLQIVKEELLAAKDEHTRKAAEQQADEDREADGLMRQARERRGY